MSGCSSGVEHNLAKVGVVGSNPIARSKFSSETKTHKASVHRGFFAFGLWRKVVLRNARSGAVSHCLDKSRERG